MITNKTVTGLVALTLAGLVSHAKAQAPILEEIVVTSRKVEEKLQDVPLAISAFNAEQIESAGIEDLNDVADLTPGLTFSNVLGEFLPVPVIRGVAPTAIFRENNAAIFVDGVYISGREGLNFNQLDLERIEVVKGPQAAMYGRNSFSGAVNFVTARPTDEFRGKAELQVGDDNLQKISGSISGPLVEGVLRGRVAIVKNEWDGSYNNANPGGPDIGGYDNESFQGSLYWTPNDQFEAGLSVYVSNDQIDDSPTSAVTPNCENTSAMGTRLENFCGELPSIGENDVYIIDRATGEDRDVIRGSLTLNWDTDFGTISALTGFSKVQQSFFVDGSRGDPTTTLAYQTFFQAFPGAFVLDTFEAEFLQIGPGDQAEEFSQELRFTSPVDRSVRYTVGGYVYGVELEATNSGIVSLSQPPFGFSNFCPCIQFFPPIGFALPAFPGASVGDLVFGPWFAGPNGDANSGLAQTNETDAWAVFGAVEADFSDRLTGRVELRYTDEEKTTVDFEAPFNLNNSWDFLTWRATLDFKPSENTMFYGSVASAEKSGDFDFDTEININGDLVSLASFIDPEKNTSFELGTKGTYVGGRLRTDIALFYIDWSEIVIPQLFATDPMGIPLTGTVSLDTNAGDATVFGIEASFDYAFTDNLTGNFGFTVTSAEFDNAKIESFIDFPTFAPDGDVSGNKILRQSEVQANATLNYRRQLRGDVDWYVRGDAAYTGKQYLGSPNQAEIPAHTYVNLRVGIDTERYTVELWSTNLFDDDNPIAGFRDVYFANALPGGGPGGFFDEFFPFRITLSHPRRRQIGLTARVRF